MSQTTHHFDTTQEAYDACQCDDNVRDGDILVIASERVVGIAATWPFAVTDQHGELHRAKDDHWVLLAAKYGTKLINAGKLAYSLGYELNPHAASVV